MVYLDTETSGLIGGSGTVAFQVGMVCFLQGRWRLQPQDSALRRREARLLKRLNVLSDEG